MVVTGFQQRDLVAPFTRVPSAGVPRVYVLGGSSVRAGSNLPAEREFPALIEAGLREQGIAAEVLNLGRPSLDSHHNLEILTEAVAFQPGLVVLYMGHNDLGNAVQDRYYGDLGGVVQLRTRLALGRLAIYALLRDRLSREPLAREEPPAEGERLQADQGWSLHDPRRVLTADQLERNLEQMVALADGVGAQTLVVTPISNWVTAGPIGRSCADVLPAHPQGKSNAPLESTPPKLREQALADALERYPDCPDLLFERGLARIRGQDEGGYSDLREALEGDVLPMRATRVMTDAARRAAADSGAALLDIERQLEAERVAPPPEWFRDAVHFSEEGHRAMADLLLPTVADLLSARTSPPR